MRASTIKNGDSFTEVARVKNHSDELIFHSQSLRRSAANLERSHRRIRNLKVHIRKTFKCEILLASLSAKRFDIDVNMNKQNDSGEIMN